MEINDLGQRQNFWHTGPKNIVAKCRKQEQLYPATGPPPCVVAASYLHVGWLSFTPQPHVSTALQAR